MCIHTHSAIALHKFSDAKTEPNTNWLNQNNPWHTHTHTQSRMRAWACMFDVNPWSNVACTIEDYYWFASSTARSSMNHLWTCVQANVKKTTSDNMQAVQFVMKLTHKLCLLIRESRSAFWLPTATSHRSRQWMDFFNNRQISKLTINWILNIWKWHSAMGHESIGARRPGPSQVHHRWPDQIISNWRAMRRWYYNM